MNDLEKLNNIAGLLQRKIAEMAAAHAGDVASLQTDLAEAQAEIERLKEELKNVQKEEFPGLETAVN